MPRSSGKNEAMVAVAPKPVGRPRKAIRREEVMQFAVEPAVMAGYRQLGLDDRRALIERLRAVTVTALTKKGVLDPGELAA